MKTMLVATSLSEADPRYKRFVKLVKRSSVKQYEIFPGLWIIQTKLDRPTVVSHRLDALLDDQDDTPREGGQSTAPVTERLFVCTILNDGYHANGWISREFWDWMATLR